MTDSATPRGRPPVPGSIRSRTLAELVNLPGGCMPLEMAAWLDADVVHVRRAMQSLVESGHAYSILEPDGGSGRPHRYWHEMYPKQPAPKPVPTFDPQRAEVIVRFSDLGPGRYLSRESWVDNYLGAHRANGG